MVSAMAQRLLIWLEHEDEAGPPSSWALILRVPFVPADDGDIDRLPFDTDEIWPPGDDQDTFVAWMKENVRDAVFEFHHPKDGWGEVCSAGSLVIPSDDDAFAVRMRWNFKKVDW